jgi:inorganic pyrophosphatase
MVLRYTDRFHLGKKAPQIVNVLIEASGGSRVKYKFSTKGHLLHDRTTHVPFPFDYGMIPKTARDGDEQPLRCIVLGSEPLLPRTVVQAKPVALVRIVENNVYHYHIIAVRVNDAKAPKLTRAVQIRLEKFFHEYESLTTESRIRVHWEGEERAKKAVLHCKNIFEKLNPTMAVYGEA